MGELVDERDRRARGRGRRRGPSPRTRCRGTRPAGAGRPRGRRSARAVSGRPWVSTKPTTTSVPRLVPAAALVEHGERLADARARRRGRCGACLGPWRHVLRACSWSSARLSSSTFTPGSPRKPSDRPSVCADDQLAHRVDRQVAGLGDPWAWSRAFATEMWGSSPRARRGHRVDGTSCRRQPVLSPVGGRPAATTSSSSVWVGRARGSTRPTSSGSIAVAAADGHGSRTGQ